MGISPFGGNCPCPVATVNRQRCSNIKELQQKLKTVLSRKLSPIEIAIHDQNAQRVLLPLAVYSPEELLPPDMRNLVEEMGRDATCQNQAVNWGISLAITKITGDSPNQTATVLGAAVNSAINKGYRSISFGTAQDASLHSQAPGAVLIRMKV